MQSEKGRRGWRRKKKTSQDSGPEPELTVASVAAKKKTGKQGSASANGESVDTALPKEIAVRRELPDLPRDLAAEERKHDHAVRGHQARRRSTRVLLFTLPVYGAILAVGLSLIGLWSWTAFSVADYRANRLGSALAGFSDQSRLTSQLGMDHWVSLFNEGTTYLRLGKVDDGIGYLENALTLVAPAENAGEQQAPSEEECFVRVNLSVGYEMRGDALMTAKNFAPAEEEFRRARETATPCVPPDPQQGNKKDQGNEKDPGESAGEQADENSQRQQGKEGDAREAQGKPREDPQEKPGKNDPKPTEPPKPSGEPKDPAEEQRQRELTKRNQQGADERNSGKSPVQRPW